MSATKDFRDLLALFEKHCVRYLIVGGYAFAFHAYPRYTKDLDILVDPTTANLARANQALLEFGSPYLFDPSDRDIILQLVVEPNRIDLILKLPNVRFSTAWRDRIRTQFGDIEANWIGLDALIRSKTGTGKPRHEEDLSVLKKVRKKRSTGAADGK